MTARLVVLLFVCASVAGAPLTPAEKRGRHIYRNGTSVSGRPIAALASGTEMDASIFPCGSCHGPEGRGVPEGNVEPSDIRWRTLQKILLPRNEIGRRRPKYDDAALARTLKDGVDSAGNALSPVMPKFRMADEDLSDLVAYLKRLGDEPQPGLAEDRITVSTTAPGARRVIEAFFADVNAGGGVHGRTLQLGEDGFAYVGAVEGTEASFGEERVPLITPFPTAASAPASFFLFSSYDSQLLALKKLAGEENVVVITGPDADVAKTLRELASRQPVPTVLIAGANVTAEIFDAPPALQNRIFIAVPALPSDVTEAGRTELLAFAERHGIPPAELSKQIPTYAAVKVFVEGLKHAGRELTRETLIAALEQLYQFPTEVTPPVTWSRNRHVGSQEVHVLHVDLEAKVFVKR